MSPEKGELRDSLEALSTSLLSLDDVLSTLEQRSPAADENVVVVEEPGQSESQSCPRLLELEAQNASLLLELKQLKLEKESFQESLSSPLREDYDFLLSDRVSLQSQLGDLNLRLHELEADLEDKKQEIQAKDTERQDFMERFQRYETEKINVLRQVLSLEKDLEASKVQLETISLEKKKAVDQVDDVQDVLNALREGKKVVENKLTKVIHEKNQGLLEVEHLRTQVLALEESLAERNTSLVEKVSFYESQLSDMQVEMDARLEEMNNSNDQTQETIKSRYVDLFEEKVQELFNLRSSYEDTLLKLESSERKRLELERELRDLQSQFTSKNEINSIKVLRLEKDLQGVKDQFEATKESCRTSVDQLRQRLRDMRAECDAKNQELLQIKSSGLPSASLQKSKISSSHNSGISLNGHQPNVAESQGPS